MRKRRRLMLSPHAVAQARSPRENADTSTTDINAVVVIPSMQKLELGPKLDDSTEGIEAIVNEKLGDYGSLTVLKSLECDQEKEIRAAGDLRESSKDCQNQALSNDDTTTADKHQALSSKNAKGDSQPTPSSIIATGTSSSMGSVVYAKQRAIRAGRPRSSYPPPQNISLSKHVWWAQG